MSDPAALPDLPQTDEALFARWVAVRDEHAYTELFARLQPRLTGFLARRLSDPETVADLCSDTFMRMTRAASSYNPASGRLSTWAHAIAQNLLRNEYRRRDRHGEVLFTDLDHGNAHARAAEVPGPDDTELRTYQNQLRAAINDAIARLSEHHRVPFVLREIEDRTYTEIADLLGMNVGTVKSRLNRARAKVRESLSEAL